MENLSRAKRRPKPATVREAARGYTQFASVAISVTVEGKEKGRLKLPSFRAWREDQSSLSAISSCGVEISGSCGA
jgi:hypothetical protein